MPDFVAIVASSQRGIMGAPRGDAVAWIRRRLAPTPGRWVMTLVDPSEMDEFLAVLLLQGIPPRDIELSEVNASDPRSDEVLAQRGMLSVTRLSTRPRE